MSELPKTVGPYRIESLIGSGGMGAVYRAFDRRLDRQVAIKHIHTEKLAAVPGIRERFRREARSAAALSHPAIVQVFDILKQEDGDWIVMELIAGPTIGELIEQQRLDLPMALAIGRRVAEGLAEAHAKGIVHRDLKVENVMVAPGGRVKILDFGLAKRLQTPEDETDLSIPGGVIGTSRSMSPEQARGYEVGPASDLFSLGTMLYEMVTGSSPFKGRTYLDTLTRVCERQQLPAATLKANVPAELDRLIDRLLEKAPERRPESAREVARTLAEIAGRLGRRQGEAEAADPNQEETLVGVALEVMREAPTPTPPTMAPRLPSAAETTHQRAPRTPPATSPDPPASADRRRRFGAAAILAALALAFAAWFLLPSWPDGLKGRSSPPSPATSQTATALTANDYNRQGRELLRRYYLPGNIEQALAAFEAAIGLDDRSALAHCGLGEGYLQKYRQDPDPLHLDRALEQASLAVEIDPHLALARSVLGMIHIRRKEYDQAEGQLREALVLDPLSSTAHRELGYLESRRGNADQAELELGKAIELNSESSEALIYRGSFFYLQSRYPEAAADLLDAVELTPDHASAYRSLGGIYHALGRYGEAAAQLQRSLEIAPNARSYSNLGTLHFFEGRYQASASAFDKAVELGANDLQSWANLADAYRWIPGKSGRAREHYTRAIQMLRRSLENGPDLELQSKLALYLAKRGDSAEASEALSALERWPEKDAAALNRESVAHEILGRRDRALELLGKALGAGFSLEEIRRDPELTELRRDARYHRLVAAVVGTDAR